jgi:hypothetical protein
MKARNLFSDAKVLEARTGNKRPDGSINFAGMARMLSDNTAGIQVSRHVAKYWSKQFDKTKKNGEHYLTLAGPNRDMRQARKLREPSITDDAAIVQGTQDTSCILFLTDNHAPYHHPDLIPFLSMLKDKYKPTMTVHGGDENDMHAMSFHDSDPDLASAGQELDLARVCAEDMHRLFPRMQICHSNHGSLLYRKAFAHGIPAAYLKSYREVLFPNGGGEGWSWHDSLRVQLPNGEDVQFQHEVKGDILKTAAHERCNLAVGHNHSQFKILYAASNASLYWGMFAGCLLDKKALAFKYGQLFPQKPIIGCALIEDSLPRLIPMLLDTHGRWVGRV